MAKSRTPLPPVWDNLSQDFQTDFARITKKNRKNDDGTWMEPKAYWEFISDPNNYDDEKTYYTYNSGKNQNEKMLWITHFTKQYYDQYASIESVLEQSKKEYDHAAITIKFLFIGDRYDGKNDRFSFSQGSRNRYHEFRVKVELSTTMEKLWEGSIVPTAGQFAQILPNDALFFVTGNEIQIEWSKDVQKLTLSQFIEKHDVRYEDRTLCFSLKKSNIQLDWKTIDQQETYFSIDFLKFLEFLELDWNDKHLTNERRCVLLEQFAATVNFLSEHALGGDLVRDNVNSLSTFEHGIQDELNQFDLIHPKGFSPNRFFSDKLDQINAERYYLTLLMKFFGNVYEGKFESSSYQSVRAHLKVKVSAWNDRFSIIQNAIAEHIRKLEMHKKVCGILLSFVRIGASDQYKTDKEKSQRAMLYFLYKMNEENNPIQLSQTFFNFITVYYTKDVTSDLFVHLKYLGVEPGTCDLPHFTAKLLTHHVSLVKSKETVFFQIKFFLKLVERFIAEDSALIFVKNVYSYFLLQFNNFEKLYVDGVDYGAFGLRNFLMNVVDFGLCVMERTLQEHKQSVQERLRALNNELSQLPIEGLQLFSHLLSIAPTLYAGESVFNRIIPFLFEYAGFACPNRSLDELKQIVDEHLAAKKSSRIHVLVSFRHVLPDRSACFVMTVDPAISKVEFKKKIAEECNVDFAFLNEFDLPWVSASSSAVSNKRYFKLELNPAYDQAELKKKTQLKKKTLPKFSEFTPAGKDYFKTWSCVHGYADQLDYSQHGELERCWEGDKDDYGNVTKMFLDDSGKEKFLERHACYHEAIHILWDGFFNLLQNLDLSDGKRKMKAWNSFRLTFMLNSTSFEEDDVDRFTKELKERTREHEAFEFLGYRVDPVTGKKMDYNAEKSGTLNKMFMRLDEKKKFNASRALTVNASTTYFSAVKGLAASSVSTVVSTVSSDQNNPSPVPMSTAAFGVNAVSGNPGVLNAAHAWEKLTLDERTYYMTWQLDQQGIKKEDIVFYDAYQYASLFWAELDDCEKILHQVEAAKFVQFKKEFLGKLAEFATDDNLKTEENRKIKAQEFLGIEKHGLFIKYGCKLKQLLISSDINSGAARAILSELMERAGDSKALRMYSVNRVVNQEDLKYLRWNRSQKKYDSDSSDTYTHTKEVLNQYIINRKKFVEAQKKDEKDEQIKKEKNNKPSVKVSQIGSYGKPAVKRDDSSEENSEEEVDGMYNRL